MTVTTSSDLENVPAALRERPQWLVWRFEQHEGEKKPRKVPYYVDGGRRVGTQGSDADHGRLVGFSDAVGALGEFSGVGFAFLPGDGLIGIDLDNVIDPDTGEIQDRAARIIAACASFTEYSPSGRGVHIYCLGETKSHKSNEIGVEMFCGRQFFTVTGRQYPGTVDDVTEIATPVLDRLHEMIDSARVRRPAPKPTATERQPSLGGGTHADRDRIESALACVSADVGYNDWIAVGMALYDALGDAVGFQVWDYWSSKGSKYGGSSALMAHWKSFSGRAPGSDAVIFKLATSAGWRSPKGQRAPPKPSTGSGAASRVQPPQEAPARDENSEDPGPDHVDDEDFRRDGRGKIQPSLFNTLRVLDRDPLWRGVLGFNQFSYRITKRRPMPGVASELGEWADIDDVRLQVYLTKTYGFEPKKPTIMDAVLHAAHEAPYHPVREYLEALRWDGVSRLPRLLAEYWGVASTHSAASLRREDPWAAARQERYFQLAGTKWLVGAVARIFRPGCKLDTMLVLEGGQGDFKSSSIRHLFGEDWFADSKLKIGDKDALANMQGKWAYEMAEMDAHRKADDTEFKQFVTSQVDRVRWHYGKRAEDVPRQSIFVGTTNMHQYGKDETGMRRIWPVEVGVVDLRRISADRDQLWAEAVALFRSGVTWWVDKQTVALEASDVNGLAPPGAGEPTEWSEWAIFDEQGESRQNVDAWETPICEWIEANNGLAYFTTADIMGSALELDRSRWTPPEQKRVAAILRRLGYRSKKVGAKYRRVNGWVKDADDSAPQGGVDDVPF